MDRKSTSISSSDKEGTIVHDVFIESGDFGESSPHIDVQHAIEEYNELKLELSRVSRISSIPASKLEEGKSDEEEFNLSSYLHDMSIDNREAGQKFKHLGVIWKNVTVEGLAPDSYVIPTIVSGLISNLQFWKYLGFNGPSKTRTILNDVSGFVKDGEMLLALGRPGAGCTTLLKIIANIRSSFTAIHGDVSYGGIDHKSFARYYRGQTCYNSEEDLHYPTLTAKQTLQFALRTKTPGTRLPDETRKDFSNKLLYLLGNMLGLTKQMDTMVGNAFVRGLSGGERKRLSIAEQMTTQSTINCWDCSTRGLDAASALDYVKSLRIMTDIFKKTTAVTLYQASDNIYNIFDKVILLDEGYTLYFGPVSKAKDYFVQLGFYCPPRKSTPDFLTGISNPLERQIRPGFEDSAPKHASEFQKRFQQSDIYKIMMEELAHVENQFDSEKSDEAFRKAMDEEHQKYAPNKSPFVASFLQQVIALTIRQYQLQIKDIESLCSRYGTIVVQALIMGSCFYNLPLDGSGAISRGGAIFFSVIFNSLVCQTELVNFLTGRPILEKHKQYALYRPSAFYLAQVIMDVPFALIQVMLFEICCYFLLGLNLTAGRFFAFFIINVMINLTMNQFFRLFGAITDNVFFSSQASGLILVCSHVLCGYVIPYKSMHPWVGWFYWINPIAYGFKALIINEMQGQVYSCEGSTNSVPSGPGYDNWDYKVCTMMGGNAGENYVLGDNYLSQALSAYPNGLWVPNFLALVGIFIVLSLMTGITMELRSSGSSETLTKLYLPGKAPKTRTVEEENERQKNQAAVTESMESVSTGTTFSWQNMNYTVPIKGGEIQLLNDINGIVKPGHLTALMGSSGAGKTTLLDVLARRKTIGKVDGRLYLNGEALINDFERITGYCEQMDIHQPMVTVREALQFSANLRQPAEVSKKEKDAYVEQIIQLLEMYDIADAQVGEVETGFGISVEERKRLTIGMELVGKPQLLFLDEPTSGLDAQSSFNIIRFIRKLADAGWPVLCTIHQPSAILFEHFDHLLLLVRGGHTAYYGEIGKDGRTMIDYFEKNGGPKCSPNANPAEYILECVGAGTAGKAKADWAEIWKKSPEAKILDEELQEIHNHADQHPSRPALTYASSFGTQLYWVHNRMALSYWRSPDYNFGRFVTIMATALIMGFTFWKMSDSVTDLRNRMFAVFMSFIVAYILIILAQPKFMTERVYFRREYASRYYGWIPFTISMIAVEVPYILFFSASFLFGFYWTSGLVNTSNAVGYFYIQVVFFVFWAVTLGFLLAALAENPSFAAVLNPLLIPMLCLFAGLMQTIQAMPKFWSSWFYWIDPIHYFVEGLSVNELQYITVECNDADLIKFLPPPGATCGNYTSNYFANGAPGYLVNPEAMQPELCGYCNFKTGKEFYSTFEWDESNRWRDFGVIIAFFIFNTICFGLLVYWKRKAKR